MVTRVRNPSLIKVDLMFCISDCSIVGMNGNIIANQGFINQFATTVDNKTGEPILSASVLTAIGTIQSVGQIVGMTTLPL